MGGLRGLVEVEFRKEVVERGDVRFYGWGCFLGWIVIVFRGRGRFADRGERVGFGDEGELGVMDRGLT